MAFGTTCPGAFVLSGVDREILSVVVEVCRGPCRLGMAFSAGNRELSRCMIWVFRLVVFCYMTSGTGIRGCSIVAIMAIGALKRDV